MRWDELRYCKSGGTHGELERHSEMQCKLAKQGFIFAASSQRQMTL